MSGPDDFDFSEAPTNPRKSPPSGDGSPSSRMMMPSPGDHLPNDPLPERIGRYRVVGQIGQGGMGVVLKATHERNETNTGEPGGHGRRQVAIKLIRQGTGTAFEDSLARFEVECHVLSALDHPNIARFIEAGTTETGDPYFVMEYVEGQPITAYCDANNLPIRERLEIFRKVCAAVHYAHSNLVVHRDIKPENILVTPEGEPKLLDFGIAKLLNANMAPAVAVTGPMMRLMTPEYASPEQVSGQPINTMSDVYSLGVLLYELLSGQRPYRLASRLEHEIVRVICETDPERPSTAVTRISDHRKPDGTVLKTDPSQIAERRSARPESLKRQLSGDLDDIVLVAMSKAPAQRFPTVSEMADEVGRHLRGEPIRVRLARRRAFYVARKFIKRHRTPIGIAASAAAIILIMGSIAVSNSISLREEQAARRIAESEARARFDAMGNAFGLVFDVAGNRKLDVGLTAQERAEFWKEIVQGLEAAAKEVAEPAGGVGTLWLARAHIEYGDALGESATGGLGQSERALEQYQNAAAAFDLAIAGSNPDEEIIYRTATIRNRIGGIYGDMNRSADRLVQLGRALQTFEKLGETGDYAGKREAGIAGVLMDIGEVHLLRCETDEAIDHLERSLAIREAMRSKYRDHRRRGPVALEWVFKCQGRLSDAYRRAGRVAEAKRLAETSLALRLQRAEGEEPDERLTQDIAVGEMRLASILAASDRAPQSLGLLDEAAGRVARLIEDDPKDAQLRTLRCSIEANAVRALLDAPGTGNALERAENLTNLCGALETELPENPKNREYRALASLLLGKAHVSLGNAEPATTALNDAWQGLQLLAAEDPTNMTHQLRLAETAIAAGDAARLGPDSGDAPLGWYTDALAIYDRLDAEGTLCGVDEAARTALRERIGG